MAWTGGVKVQDVAWKGWAKEEKERRDKSCARRHMERERERIMSTTVERERKGRIAMMDGKKGKRKWHRKQYMRERNWRKDVGACEKRGDEKAAVGASHPLLLEPPNAMQPAERSLIRSWLCFVQVSTTS